MTNTPTLSIVIVSWNVCNDLRECLTSIFSESYPTDAMEVIVVDNASTDDTVDMVQREFPQVEVIVNDENLGYTEASNQGIRVSRGKFILLLNPDTTLQAGTIKSLIAFVKNNPKAGIIGPKLLNIDGSVQHSARSFPDIWAGLFRDTPLGRLFPQNPFVRRYLLSDFSYDEVREVDWVSGAAMLVRREVFDRIGLLDGNFWAYCEDVDFCWRAKQARFKVVFYPHAVVIHKIGRSSDQRLIPSLIQHHKSMWCFYLKNYKKRYPIILLPLIGFGIFTRLVLKLASVSTRLMLSRLRLQLISTKTLGKSTISSPINDPPTKQQTTQQRPQNGDKNAETK